MHASFLKTAGAAWVTGAGRGIGQALVLRLATRGWTVAVSSRTEQELASLAADTPGLPGSILPFVLDIVDPVATAAAVQRIRREIGPLDLAILNAGTHRAVSAQWFDVAMVKSVVDVNLLGTVNCLSAILPDFIKRRCGKIVVIASVAGSRGLPTAAAYGATKAA
jgi:NADP-dependent 3-hydroxy acid dehydrogenase YdfG